MRSRRVAAAAAAAAETDVLTRQRRNDAGDSVLCPAVQSRRADCRRAVPSCSVDYDNQLAVVPASDG